MATYASHEERLIHLRALYEQAHEQRGSFSECIEQCERALESGIAPYWRIKIFCILVGANMRDWNKAEEWRQAAESVYRSLPKRQRESLDDYPSTKDLRESLDDFYAYQAEDAPFWFKESERLNALYPREEIERRELLRYEEQQQQRTLAPTSIGEEDEDEDMEDVMPQFDGAGDEAAASSGEVGETDDKDEEEVDDEDKAVEGVAEIEGVEAVDDDGESEVDKEQTQLDESAWWDGGAKNKPSFMSRVIKRTQSRMGLKGDNRDFKNRRPESGLAMRLKAKASKSASDLHLLLKESDEEDDQY